MKYFIIFFISVMLYGNIHFNSSERIHLQKHKEIRYCLNKSLIPIEYIEESTEKGITIDVIKVLEKKLPVTFKFIPVNSFQETLKKLHNNECDLASGYNYIPKDSNLLTTKNLFMFHQGLVTQNNNSYLECISTKTNQVITLKKDDTLIENLQSHNPKKPIIIAKSHEETLDNIINNKAFYTIIPEPIFSYYKNDSKYSKIYLSGLVENPFEVKFITTKQNKPLISILNKSFHHMEEEIFTIKRLWDIEPSHFFVSKSFITHFITFTIFILIILLYRYYITKQYNKKLEIEVKESTKVLKKKNTQLHESLKSFQILLDVAIETIVVLDENTKIIEANQAALKMFQYNSKQDPIGIEAANFIPKYELAKFKKAMKEDFTPPYEVDLYRKDKSIFPALVGGRYITRNGRKLRITTIIDLSEIKRKDKLLKQQTKLASMGEMISMIAHQWRQPLNILGALNMKLETKLAFGETINQDSYQEISKEVNEQLQYMSKTIDDFRDFYKPKNTMQKIDFNLVIEFSLKMMSALLQNNNISLALHLNCHDLFNAYLNEVQQVLLNLLKNSLDVLIERKIKNPSIAINTYSNKEYCILEVKDNGGGIEPELLEKIFNPYFTTKTKMNGTGLGLYMSKVMVEEHCDGKLTVENNTQGATFKITFNKMDT